MGDIFPVHTRPDQALSLYSQYFNSVEGNTSFYHIPSEQSVRKWNEVTPEHFRFTFKFPRQISHENNLVHCEGLVAEFYQRLEPLGEKVATLMLQLPERFSPQSLPLLADFLQHLPQQWPVAVEVRHRGFFDKSEQEKAFNQLLLKHHSNRIIMDTRGLFACSANGNKVIIDAQNKKPRLPVHAIATGQFPIVRFVGHSNLKDNDSFYQPWMKKLYQWQQEGRQPCIFFHTASNADAPRLAQRFFAQMKSQYPDAALPDIPLPAVSQQQTSLF